MKGIGLQALAAMRRPRVSPRWATAGMLLAAAAGVQAQNTVVYRCPGNPVLYTDTLSAKEARDKGCRTLEGAPITVIQSSRPRTGTPVPAASTPPGARVDPADQRARDSDRRRILEAELRREEQSLQALQKEYNNGEPERRGDERNYQKYLDRVAEMKATLSRKESDVAALKREIGKLPPASNPGAIGAAAPSGSDKTER